jgi:hypothetical protein
VFTIVTVALGTMAPVESATTPLNPPVTAVCADAEEIKPGSVADAKLKIATNTTLRVQRLKVFIYAPKNLASALLLHG